MPWVKPGDQRRVAVGRDQRREHLDVAPGRAVDAALVRAVDVGLHRAAAPRLAAGRQLDVDASFRAAADAGAAARTLAAALADQRVGAGEEIRMILDELAQADVHPLLVAFGDEDQVDRHRAGDRLDRHQRVPVGELRPLRVGGAAADQHLLVRPLFDQVGFERRLLPRVGLRHRHRVVLPVDRDRARRAVVAFRVDHRVAGRAPFGDADVVDPRRLAAELLEEALHHLGRLGNALAAVGDARLADPLLQVLDVVVDVLVDVAVDLLQLIGRDLGHVDVDLGVALRADAELRLGLGLRRPGLCAFADGDEQPAAAPRTAARATNKVRFIMVGACRLKEKNARERYHFLPRASKMSRRVYVFVHFVSVRFRAFRAQKSNFTPKRASRGPMIVDGVRNVAPELQLMLVAAFELARL